jgi:hypothetical protein
MDNGGKKTADDRLRALAARQLGLNTRAQATDLGLHHKCPITR